MNILREVFFVFIGGGIGCSIRYLISKLNSPSFPLGTFIVNLFGCFLLGVFMSWAFKNLQNDWVIFLTFGICGGVTTFSAFSHEALFMIKQENWILFITYSLSSIILGILMIRFGYSFLDTTN
tara:strand:- start:8551 stop:8919 length:369 start_codon:yes stop_codon:yes gene_type:complete